MIIKVFHMLARKQQQFDQNNNEKDPKKEAFEEEGFELIFSPEEILNLWLQNLWAAIILFLQIFNEKFQKQSNMDNFCQSFWTEFLKSKQLFDSLQDIYDSFESSIVQNDLIIWDEDNNIYILDTEKLSNIISKTLSKKSIFWNNDIIIFDEQLKQYRLFENIQIVLRPKYQESVNFSSLCGAYKQNIKIQAREKTNKVIDRISKEIKKSIPPKCQQYKNDLCQYIKQISKKF